MSDSKVTDSARQAYDGRGGYSPSGRAAAGMNAAKSAGAGSSVVSLDGSSGSSDKSAKAQREIQPNTPDKRVDNLKQNVGGPVPGQSGQSGSPVLDNPKSVTDR